MTTHAKMSAAPFLVIHPEDNIATALRDLHQADSFVVSGRSVALNHAIPIKHKFAIQDLAPGDTLKMYGLTVGRAMQPIRSGDRITVKNVEHATGTYALEKGEATWTQPNVQAWEERTFQGYHRANGQVGTMNYWLVIPLVFCENRNVLHLQKVLEKSLGYATQEHEEFNVDKLVDLYRRGDVDAIETTSIYTALSERQDTPRVFEHVDGIKFLTHEHGCGCTDQDNEVLCRLLAGYIDHPNVAGATVLSLGCQKAQINSVRGYLQRRGAIAKPVYYLNQQDSRSERHFLEDAIKKTFAGLVKANQVVRQPAPLSKLCLGLECGGSDGFSGITANPALGHTADLLVALGGSAILSEFPELNGVEQELIHRCQDEATAEKFVQLMSAYSNKAEAAGSGFKENPSPGNVADGLITDAIKSAGAARKGGLSPVRDVLDYGEPSTRQGLNLLCTPGSDVESTTGLAGSGANLIVFTTGLGTPTGNPVAPTVKMSTNTSLAMRMPDIIDIDAGTIISGEDTIESKGEELLNYLIEVASGEATPHAVRLRQDDFIPWKRQISL